MSQWGAADAPFDVDSFDLDAGSFLASWACQICTFRHEGPRATFLRCEMCSATRDGGSGDRCNNAREATSEPRVNTSRSMGSAPTVKSEPDVYEPCYDCAVCWESCRSNLKANKRLMTCVRCPAVRMVHGACYDKMARKSCTQCNGPMSEYQHPSKTNATNRAGEGEASRSSEPSADRSFASVNKCAAESDLDG